MLNIIAKNLGKRSILYAYYLQLQASFYSNLDDVDTTITLREEVEAIYSELKLGDKPFINADVKENKILLAMIKAFQKIEKNEQ